MKKRIITTIALAALIFTTAAAISPATAYAATKTATLTDTKVSFDGKEPVIIQSYRIDGYNYVRVAEIAKHIGMGVMPAYHEVGVLIQPTEPYTGGELERITDASIAAELTTGTVFYDGMRYENAQCFNYKNRYYYKLADLIAASEYALEQNIEFTKSKASSSYYKEARVKSYPSFEITWDSATSTAKVNRNQTDLQKLFDDIRGNKTVAQTPKAAPTPVAQPELTAPPETGTVLANILLDKDKGAYNADGSVNTGNLTEYYRDKSASYVGQCTWYAFGRFEETTGIDLSSPPNHISGKTLDEWAEKAMTGNYPNVAGTTDKSAIASRSIAVWSGHVVFIEYVECDSSGNPKNIYYTEANANHDGKTRLPGVYYPDYDCKVKVKAYSDFVKGGLLGYVTAK